MLNRKGWVLGKKFDKSGECKTIWRTEETVS